MVLRVEALWDGDGADAVQKYEFRISVPLDHEALEKILGVKKGRPFVNKEEMPLRISVEACKEARIAIRGEKLWKNSIVLLFNQRADEVEILPDMKGILAYFKNVERPAQGRNYLPSEVRGAESYGLFVYTSEGTVRVDIPVSIEGECKTGK